MREAIVVRHEASEYPVFIGRGVAGEGRAILKEVLPGRTPYIVTTPAVLELAAEAITAGIGAADVLTLPDGEASKSFEAIVKLAGELLARGARRDAVIIAIGGGALGDAAGFAASIYLRGVALIHVPTTLLAQVDSSIGGKVAINHPAGKNLIGSFHAPAAVISDIDFLSSLSEREICSGALEALKGGVIGDPSLFDLIELERQAIGERRPDILEQIVRRAVAVKAAIVSEDAQEADLRRLLNYGHTIGHGIEAAMGYEGITHGEAVGLGMIGANAVAVARHLIDEATALRIDEAVRDLLTVDPPSLDVSDVLKAAEHDKKFGGGKRVMVLPRDIGHCDVVDDVTEEELRFAAERALAG